jgi:hypothetical protein
MARGFMDVRRAIEAMEGAYPNDPNRSILSLNKRPKARSPQSAIVASMRDARSPVKMKRLAGVSSVVKTSIKLKRSLRHWQ